MHIAGVIAERKLQCDGVLHRRAPTLTDVGSGVVGGIAEHGDPTLDPGVERVEVEDFHAVGGHRIQFVDQGLHPGCPVAEVPAQHLSCVAALVVLLLVRVLRHHHVEEEVEPAVGHRHHRDPFAVTDIGGPLGGGADRFVGLDQAVEVDIPGVAPGDRCAQHVLPGDRAGPVGADDHVGRHRGSVGERRGGLIGAVGDADHLHPEVDLVHAVGLHQHRLEFGACDGVGALADLVDQRLHGEAAHRLTGVGVEVAHRVDDAAQSRGLFLEAEVIEALDPVGPHRDRGADGLVLGDPFVDLGVDADLAQCDRCAHAAHSGADDDRFHSCVSILVSFRGRWSRRTGRAAGARGSAWPDR